MDVDINKENQRAMASGRDLNVTWREKICQWTYNVVDQYVTYSLYCSFLADFDLTNEILIRVLLPYSFDLSREVVAVSLDLFDRYLATRNNECSGNLALLTSLTTLHIAIKIHDSKKIKIATLANLSRGQFGPKHIEEMEWKVLSALRWKLHPPTQYAFVSHMLLFLPNEAHPAVRKEVFELSRYLTELAVCDTFFVDIPNSIVAFAAILNVMEDSIGYARLSAGIRERFIRILMQKVGLSPSDPVVMASRERLRTMFVATASNEVLSVSNANGNSNTNSTSGGQSQNKMHHDSNSSDVISMASTLSSGSHRHRFGGGNSVNGGANRSRAGSIGDGSSKGGGSCRYSPSPHRRFLMASASPLTSSRHAHLSASPIVAGTQ